MGADISRIRHNPLLDFCGVDLQQGRVLDDGDINELKDIVDRRLRALASDTLGRATVGSNTPDAFRIEAAGGKLTIGRGRMYVDGLLAENHGSGAQQFDPLLAEARRKDVVPYDQQPYWPQPDALPADNKRHLVYLDAWLREVTWLEQPDLIEPALGVDTTTRTQTVWQVRLLQDVGTNVTCATPDDQIPKWQTLIKPSAARLSSLELGVAPEKDPCKLPPSGGYRGLENQTYRVEIHDGGKPGQASFKWSRENASVATNIVGMNAAGSELTVASVKRDDVLRFSTGDWVEITDDWREFQRLPGDSRRVTVDDARRTLTLDSALSADLRQSDAKQLADRHFRVRRWDQHGEVRDDQGTLIVDVDAAASKGVIPINQAGQKIVLENGVAVAFELDADIADGEFHAGDYWVFAARTVNASVEILEQAPPRGIHHHYARLALVTFPDSETDCRVLWPPKTGGDSCACTVCVTPESHASGALTIQKAIDEVKAKGGTVCLAAGIYALGETPLAITEAQSLRIKGQGWRTLLTAAGTGIVVRSGIGVALEDFALVSGGGGNASAPAINFVNSIGVRMERCTVLQVGTSDNALGAVALGGTLFGMVLRENLLISRAGVLAPLGLGLKTQYLATASLAIEDNVIWCQRSGIALQGMSLHFGDTRICGNTVLGCTLAGIAATGATLPGSGVDVRSNRVMVSGSGIVVGVDGARVEGNDISGLAGTRSEDGIVIAFGLDASGMDRCQVLGNRVLGMGGDGIAISGPVRSAMIKHNVVEAVGGAGIAVRERGAAHTLVIENNQLLNIAPAVNDADEAPAGIRVVRAQHVYIAGNTVRGVGMAAVQGAGRFGIQAAGVVSVRVADNEVSELGPPDEFVGAAIGINVVAPYERVDVSDNQVRRHAATNATPNKAGWAALVIAPPTDFRLRLARSVSMLAAGDLNVVLTDKAVFAVAAGAEAVAVRGNSLEARGGVPCALVSGKGDCVLADNLIVQTAPGGTITARVAGAAVIVSSNRLRGTEFSLAIDADPKRVTVLGNIAQAGIAVQGAPLAAPWNALNVIGV